MAGKRKTCTAEFKLFAVKMVTEQKLSVPEAARRLGVGENLLHTWKKALARDGANAFPGSGHLCFTRPGVTHCSRSGSCGLTGSRASLDVWSADPRGTRRWHSGTSRSPDGADC
ncbi:transposase [Gemmata sp. G18]|uniref:Transposase n=1 Tax=Gemmata palustris TaxID=2822762 RepID=A0ABS5BMI3_9BACT|nr:transposase [Gemmata palustris]